MNSLGALVAASRGGYAQQTDKNRAEESPDCPANSPNSSASGSSQTCALPGPSREGNQYITAIRNHSLPTGAALVDNDGTVIDTVSCLMSNHHDNNQMYLIQYAQLKNHNCRIHITVPYMYCANACMIVCM